MRSTRVAHALVIGFTAAVVGYTQASAQTLQPMPSPTPSASPTTAPSVIAPVAQSFVQPSTSTQQEAPDVQPSTNPMCNAKYGKVRGAEGFIRYMHAVLSDMVELYDMTPEQRMATQLEPDFDNDYLCWMTREQQVVARYFIGEVVFIESEVMNEMSGVRQH